MKRFLAAAYQKISDVLPSWLSGWLDWHLFPALSNSFGGPLNGQSGRREIFREVLQKIPFQAIVETGTYRGTTTSFLHDVSRLPVYTIEAVPRFFYYSRERFRSYPGIHSALGDSRAFLQDLSRRPEFPKNYVFFYLDAHWQNDLPLAQELEIIAECWSDPVILVDDFEVPDDPGYRYDDYGEGKRLRLEYLPGNILSGFRLFWPVIRSYEETGLRRGCVIIARTDAATRLAALPVLREIAGIASGVSKA
jgi:hypothetical protein